MIARIWHGWTTPGNAEAYLRLLQSEVLPDIAAMEIPGFLGAEVLRRVAEERGGGEGDEDGEGDEPGDLVEFVTVLRFESLESVRAFVGEDHGVAHVPSDARAILERFEERSRHYDVVHADPEVTP